jgi:hypothetical protein
MVSMRRAVAYGLIGASIPVGAGLGLWMAQLTIAPTCLVLGLGTAALCDTQPMFAPSFCVLCGGAAAAVLLLLSIAVHRPASFAAAFDLGAAGAGILIGLWASLIVSHPPCAPGQLCDGIGWQRFTSWESGLIGAAAATAIIALGCAGSSDLRHVNLGAARRLRGWLFKDLSQAPSIGDPGMDAG